MIQSSFGVTGFEPSTTPPDGPPTNAVLYSYGGDSYVGLSWTNGDPDAETQIGYAEDPNGTTEPTSVLATVAPGVTGYENNLVYVERCFFWVRHKRGGQLTAWVRCNHSFGCGDLLL